MCGIAGIVSPGRLATSLTAAVERMCAALHHRGPDGTGTYVADGIALGHARLAIIDLSERGQQPMTNEDGSLHLVVNGEIYNYVDLRAELQARGHSFRSHSDSEVVLHLYEEYGEDCMQRLEGMFALALWDAPRRSLLLARDRFDTAATSRPTSILKPSMPTWPCRMYRHRSAFFGGCRNFCPQNGRSGPTG